MTLAISAAHRDLLLNLRDDGAPRIVVIGAAALGHHIPLQRVTADVDLVIFATEEAISALLDNRHWKRDPRQRQRWHDGADHVIDVLPGTPEVISSGSVTLVDAQRELSTVGFDLALEHAAPVKIPGTDQDVDVASLASIVVLKMVAWLDRQHDRKKDLQDLGRVFETALSDWDDRRFEPPLADLEHEVQAAFFVGRAVGAIARESHRRKIEEFLTKVSHPSWIGSIGVGGLVCTDPDAVVARRLAAFRSGFET